MLIHTYTHTFVYLFIGAGRTMLMACISEANGSQIETLRTLKFSMSAARIKNKPVRFLSSHDKLGMC